MQTSEETFLILGLGNTLLTDEAVGVRTIEYLRTLPQAQGSGLRLIDGGTMGMTLLVEMEDADALVVVDAAYLKQGPGTVQVFEGPDMDAFLRQRGRSPHDIGLDDLMDGLRLREAMPERRALIGIEPSVLTVGEQLTPLVAAAVPLAAQAVLELAENWSRA